MAKVLHGHMADLIEPEDVKRAILMLKRGTALGCDLWDVEFLRLISGEMLQLLADLFNNIESTGAWPEHIMCNIIVLMGKPPPGGTRPIALMPMIYMIWSKIRKPLLDEWCKNNHGPWDAAIAVSSALRAALLQC